MIIEIEYYKKDTLLSGKAISLAELKKQLETTENIHDTETDNFTEMLCRNYGYVITETDMIPDYVYDRDIRKLYLNFGRIPPLLSEAKVGDECRFFQYKY